jgi:hypothetical protein
VQSKVEDVSYSLKWNRVHGFTSSLSDKHGGMNTTSNNKLMSDSKKIE